tara:strand:- start:388 stop:1359 length:972 start_codon:yes stop_codon:yes gene_type:complete
MSENNTQRIKVQIKRRNPPIIMADIKDQFSSYGYFQSSQSLINKINAHFGLPTGQLDWRFYDNHFREIVEVVLDQYTIRQHSGLTSKFAAITKAMKLGNVECSFMYMSKSLLQIPLKMTPEQKEITPWSSTVEDLKEHRACMANNNGYNVLTIYMHGYPVRLGEIVHTSIIDDEKTNFLDLDNLTWYIRKDFTKNRLARQFEITQELADDLKGHIHKSGRLVCRKAGTGFSSNITLKSIGIDYFKVNDIRNSYETMNLARTDIDDKSKFAISNNVLGHSTSVAYANYTNNELAHSMLDSIDDDSQSPKEGLIEPKDFCKMPMV